MAEPTKTDQPIEIPKLDFSKIGRGDGGGAAGGGSSSSDAGKGAYLSSLVSTYLSLWGVAPPPGYIDRIAASHMNVFEFESHERAKAAFRNTRRYQEERLGIELRMSQLFGSLGT